MKNYFNIFAIALSVLSLAARAEDDLAILDKKDAGASHMAFDIRFRVPLSFYVPRWGFSITDGKVIMNTNGLLSDDSGSMTCLFTFRTPGTASFSEGYVVHVAQSRLSYEEHYRYEGGGKYTLVSTSSTILESPNDPWVSQIECEKRLYGSSDSLTIGEFKRALFPAAIVTVVTP